MRKARGQCSQRLPARPTVEAVTPGQILPPAAPIAGRSGRQDYKKSIIYWLFRDGTALADQQA